MYRTSRILGGVLGAVFLVGGCASTRVQEPAYLTGYEQPIYTNMGSHHRTIATQSRAAQQYFDQGLTWTYSFNHDEAIRMFTAATIADPECAMAYWGIALCHGPHINNPAMSPERSQAANVALAHAVARIDQANPADQALIRALTARYADPIPADRIPLDSAYAKAMSEVHRQFPEDNDVAVLYAESMMDLRPWDFWSHDGAAQPGTSEIVSTLERVLARDAKHPGANHLYIHAIEASPHPEKADAAADRLRTLIPGSGHMVHMPAHIDVRTGRWQKAADQNEEAIRVDERYQQLSPHQEFYRLYMLHNHQFLAYACMMEGRREDAVRATGAMLSSIPDEVIRSSGPMLDGYTPIGSEVLVRFGMWDTILRMPQPPETLPITIAFWRQARATALGAQGDVPAARAEQAKFRAAVRDVPEGAMMAINPAANVLQIADLTLEGELLYREGDIDAAVSNLRAAAALEDQLRYMEPPDWLQPVRHSLGAILLASDRAADAETVYREDLQRWPENGWALFGLARSLEMQGKTKESASCMTRFKKAWSRADTTIEASCLCVTK